MSRTDFSLTIEMTGSCHSEEQRSCDVGVLRTGAYMPTKTEILTSDVPSSSE